MIKRVYSIEYDLFFVILVNNIEDNPPIHKYLKLHVMNKNRISYIYVSMLMSLFLPHLLSAQLVNTSFGQNRLQYEKHQWYRYESDNFAISFPIEMEGLAKQVIEQAEVDYSQLKNILEFQVKNKIELLLFKDYKDYLQNNIGLYNQIINTGGTTRMHSHKILLYPSEKQVHIFEQLRSGISEAIVHRMIYGSNFQEVVQSSVLLPLPRWFIDGMIYYASTNWNTDYDNDLREMFLNGSFDNFIGFSEKHPKIAGLSMFHFISQVYGHNQIANLIYLTRINRDVQSGFLYVFNTSYYNVCNEWYNYYKNRYLSDMEQRKIPNKGELDLQHVKGKEVQLKEVSISPNGKYATYTTISKGIYEVWLHHIGDNKAKKIWKGGLKSHSKDIPMQYPRTTFSSNGLALYILSQEKNKIHLSSYSISEDKITQTKNIKGLDFVHEMQSAEQGQVVVNALKNGQGDLFLIQVQSGNVQAITNNLYDEANPIFMEWGGKKGFVFSSYRNSHKMLKNKPKLQELYYSQLYFMPLNGKEEDIIQLTHNEFSRASQAIKLNNTSIAYLSDESGINNRYICQLDTVLDYQIRHLKLKDGTEVSLHADSAYAEMYQAHIIDSQYMTPVLKVTGKSIANTDYSRSILAQDIAIESNKVLDLLFYSNQYKLFVRDMNLERVETPLPTAYRKQLIKIHSAKPAFNPHSTSIGKTTVMPTPNITKPIQTPTITPTPITNNLPNSIESNSPTDAFLNEQNSLSQKNKNEAEAEKTISNPTPSLSDDFLGNIANTTVDTLPKSNNSQEDKIDLDNYLFGSEYENINNPVKADTIKPKTDIGFERNRPKHPQPTIIEEDSLGNIQTQPLRPVANNTIAENIRHSYDSGQKKPYNNLFKADGFSVQLDNTPLFGGLDMYMGGPYTITPLHIGAKTNFTDVFENYRFELGLRVPLNFSGIDYYVVFENRKHMIDQKYSFYRRSRNEEYTLVDSNSQNYLQSAKGRNIKHFAQAEFKYPLNQYQSLRASLAMQHEQVSIIAEDLLTLLGARKYTENRFWLRLEYVHDNTVEIGKNMRKGSRFKAYADIFQPMRISTEQAFKVDFSGAHTGALGIDWRYYVSLKDKHIFALRASGATSLGREKILYSLGGPDNWLFSQTDNLIPLPSTEGFAYQTLAAPLRGFSNNIRNGSSFFVLNAEFRISLAEVFNISSGKSKFMRSLQFVPFVDIGTAWQGLSPFSKDNPINTSVIDINSPGSVSPIRVRINYYRQPIVMGFGAGLRAMVSSYYVKADLGFGLETGVVRSPMLQFSLGTDF